MQAAPRGQCGGFRLPGGERHEPCGTVSEAEKRGKGGRFEKFARRLRNFAKKSLVKSLVFCGKDTKKENTPVFRNIKFLVSITYIFVGYRF